MNYAILYQSFDGNTAVVARHLYQNLNTANKTIRDLTMDKILPNADVYLVGFGIHGATCGADIIDCLEKLEGKKIALFATCGYSPTEACKAKLERSLTVWLPDTSEYLGMFLCQGRVRPEQKKTMLAASQQWEQALSQMLSAGDEHPNSDDLRAAVSFLRQVTKKANTRNIPIL